MKNQKILVTLRRNDAVEEILPYVEKVANAGTKVAFILQYPVESSLFPAGYWITTESVKQAVEAGKDLMRRSSWEAQKALAEARIAFARAFLEQRGAEVSVELSAGGLKATVQKLTAGNDTGTLLMYLARKSSLIEFLRRMLGLFYAFGASSPNFPVRAQAVGEAPVAHIKQRSLEQKSLPRSQRAAHGIA